MTLREKIEDVLSDKPDDVAVSIILMLEEEGLGLCGNGWLDDDPKMIDLVNS